MFECKWKKEVERIHDCGLEIPESLRAHMTACPECTAYADWLSRIHAGVDAVREDVEISDAQFGAFMRGIQDGLEKPAPRSFFAQFSAYASLAAAALLVSISIWYIFTGGRQPVVQATVIESVASDIKGATVTTYTTENGGATIWVNAPQDDL